MIVSTNDGGGKGSKACFVLNQRNEGNRFGMEATAADWTRAAAALAHFRQCEGAWLCCRLPARSLRRRRTTVAWRGERVEACSFFLPHPAQLGEMIACKPPVFTCVGGLDRWSGCTIDPEGVVDTGPLGQHEAARAQQPTFRWRDTASRSQGPESPGRQERSLRAGSESCSTIFLDARRIACRLQALRERQRPPGGRP